MGKFLGVSIHGHAAGGFTLKHDFSSRWRTGVLAILLAASGWTHAPTLATAAGESLEYSVKAAYVYKFGGFIAWPNDAFESDSSPATVCVVGEDPFGGILEKVVEGQRINDRPIAIKRLESVGQRSGCQILFVAGFDERKNSEVLAAVRGESVLTITDGARTPEATGIINFVIVDNRVRFEIDDHAASVNGVTISSKLLDLAKSAKRRG